MKVDKTQEMRLRNKVENEKKYADTKRLIIDLILAGNEVSPTIITKEAHVSRSFLYNHKDLLSIINDNKGLSTQRSESSSQVIIKAQQLKIQSLEKTIKELKKLAIYKEKYEDLLQENKRLEQQLTVAYKNCY